MAVQEIAATNRAEFTSAKESGERDRPRLAINRMADLGARLARLHGLKCAAHCSRIDIWSAK